jgi:hypothetical protein
MIISVTSLVTTMVIAADRENLGQLTDFGTQVS